VSTRVAAATGALVAAAGSVAIAFSASGMGDYPIQMAPAVNALAHGDLGRFFDLQPVYGCLAPLVQAPFAAAGLKLGAANELLLYRLAALPCLLAVGLLGAQLARLAAKRGQTLVACVAISVLTLVNPATFAAIEVGHPEELLAAALAIGSVLAIVQGRSLRAAVLLGLALATKQWAVLAIPAVLVVATSGQRIRIGLATAAMAAAFTLPLVIAEPERFAANARATEGATVTVSRFSVWWPVSSREKEAVFVGDGVRVVTVHRLPRHVTAVARPLILALALALGMLWLRRRRGPLEDGLALLALVLLLRCLLDPLDNAYYHVPFLLSLLAWEALRRRGLPVLTLLAAGGLWAAFEPALVAHPILDNALHLGGAAMLSGWISLSLFAPAKLATLGSRLESRRQMSIAATRVSLHAPNT
jgi:hypothetical protein